MRYKHLTKKQYRNCLRIKCSSLYLLPATINALNFDPLTWIWREHDCNSAIPALCGLYVTDLTTTQIDTTMNMVEETTLHEMTSDAVVVVTEPSSVDVTYLVPIDVTVENPLGKCRYVYP